LTSFEGVLEQFYYEITAFFLKLNLVAGVSVELDPVLQVIHPLGVEIASLGEN
jgi:hypothetical protein